MSFFQTAARVWNVSDPDSWQLPNTITLTAEIKTHQTNEKTTVLMRSKGLFFKIVFILVAFINVVVWDKAVRKDDY